MRRKSSQFLTDCFKNNVCTSLYIKPFFFFKEIRHFELKCPQHVQWLAHYRPDLSFIVFNSFITVCSSIITV